MTTHKCPTCKRRHRRKTITCKHCIDRAGARRSVWRLSGLCVDCRMPSQTRRCALCSRELHRLRAVRRGANKRGKSKPVASPVIPSTEQLAALREKCARGVPYLASRDRKISNRMAAEMRKRGWLLPENERYASGSWAAR